MNSVKNVVLNTFKASSELKAFGVGHPAHADSDSGLKVKREPEDDKPDVDIDASSCLQVVPELKSELDEVGSARPVQQPSQTRKRKRSVKPKADSLNEDKEEDLEESVDFDIKPALRSPMSTKKRKVGVSKDGLERVKLEKEEGAKRNAKYAPPEKYAHLQYLTDYLEQDLDGACVLGLDRLYLFIYFTLCYYIFG
jgi:hypothetical protein